MGKKLYVGNLPYSVKDSDLHQAFSAHGAVQSAQVIMDRDSGRSKGFGFVELEDGAGDAFLHVSVLSRAGYTTVQPGTPMRVRTSAGQKGPQVAEVVSVEEGVTVPTSSPSPRSGPRTPRPAPDLSSAVEMRGTVKWFNPEKGFGFVMPEGGGKDVFVHISALSRGGLTTLEPNQEVRLQVAEGRRGPEAVSVEPA